MDTRREPGCHRPNSIAGWTDVVGPAIRMTPLLLSPPVADRDERPSRRTGRPQWVGEIAGEDTDWMSNDGGLNRPGAAQMRALMPWSGAKATQQCRAGKLY